MDLCSATDVSDADLVTFTHHLSIHDAGVMGGRTAAPAQRRNRRFNDPVGQLNEALRSGKKLRPKIGQDPEAVDVDVKVIDDPSQLVNLLTSVELGLIADEVIYSSSATKS